MARNRRRPPDGRSSDDDDSFEGFRSPWLAARARRDRDREEAAKKRKQEPAPQSQRTPAAQAATPAVPGTFEPFQAGGLSWSPRRPDILELLQKATINETNLIPDGSNYSFVVRMQAEDSTGDCTTSVAIYKPQSGEAPLYDFPSGTLYRREVAAYQLSAAMGWDIVPPTIVRDGPHGIGMAQVFIDTPRRSYGRLSLDVETAQRICLFDIVTNNADRKGGHCLVDADEHIWGIDHGLTFHRQYKLRTVIWNFAGEPIPETLTADLWRLLDLLTTSSPLRCVLEDLIVAGEIAALGRRVETLLKDGVYPSPGDRRSVPWPPF